MRQTSALLCVAVLGAFGCAGGGGKNAGGCYDLQSTGWTTEVLQSGVPGVLGANRCPIVTHDSGNVAQGILVDILPSVYGSSSAITGHVGMVQHYLIASDTIPVNSAFTILDNAPTVTNGEYAHRGTATWNVWYGRANRSGHNAEVDSLGIYVPTLHTYDGHQYVYRAFAATLSRDPTAGTIIGPASPNPGGASYVIQPEWDTTAYAYRWYLNGSGSSGDTNATYSHTFSYHGSYTLRNDQMLSDSMWVTSTLGVSVPITAAISGDESLMNGDAGSWSVSVAGAHSPYSCAWAVDYSVVQTGSCGAGYGQTFFDGPTSHQISVEVTDNDSALGESYPFSVSIHNCSPGCDYDKRRKGGVPITGTHTATKPPLPSAIPTRKPPR
jgi:hypothetical protein